MTSRTFPLSRQRRRRADSERRAGPSSGAQPPGARLPHEHDEHADVPHAPRRPIVQAEQDLNAGLQDTDRRGDAARVFDQANREPRKPRR